MMTYVVLATFTDQGIKNAKDSPKRAEAFRQMAKTFGVTVKDIFWTQGRYDIVTIVEAPDELSATALNLSLGALGNIRTEFAAGIFVRRHDEDRRQDALAGLISRICARSGVKRAREGAGADLNSFAVIGMSAATPALHVAIAKPRRHATSGRAITVRQRGTAGR